MYKILRFLDDSFPGEIKMKKFFAVFALFIALTFVAACGGSGSSGSSGNSASDGCSTYKEYECRGDASYFCGYAEDGSSLKWYFHKSCGSGCDTATGKCNPDSDESDSGTPDTDNPDTAQEQPDDGDSTPDSGDSEADDGDTGTNDDNDTSVPDDNTDLTPDNGDSQPDDNGDSTSDNDYSVPDDGDSGTNDDDSDTELTDAEKCAAAGGTWNDFFGLCLASSSGENLTLGNICTGQTLCYNASSSITCPASPSGTDAEYNFFGQDAQYTGKCTAQSFTDSSDVVVDNNTGLTWEKSPSIDAYMWDNRATHCNELNSSNYGGKSNWRVPNPLELLTIVNNSTYNPATNSNFTGMPTEDSTYLWTNNEYKSNTSYAYFFSPSYGWDWDEDKTNTYKVLCVSGEEMKPAVSSDFATSSDGKIVTDNRTGLMWQKEYVADKTWKQALAYCQSLNTEGYGGYSSGWRLPNKNELASLVNYEKSAKPYSYFPDMPSSYFWSSSTRVNVTNIAWSLYFYNGSVGNTFKANNSNVRCVR